MVKLEDFTHRRLKSKNHLIQHRRQHHRKVLLKQALSFEWSNLRISATDLKNHLVQHNKQHHRKVLLSSFHLNGNIRISIIGANAEPTLH